MTMLTADRMMMCTRSPASPFDDVQHARDEARSPKAKRLFMRKLPDDPLARFLANALRQEQWDQIARHVREQEKRRLQASSPYRLLRSLAAWIG
jgi:hypothetical protein